MRTQSIKLMVSVVLQLGFGISTFAGSTKGTASEIQAYYDHNLFTIQFVEFSPAAEKALLQHNGSLNFIYQSDPGLPDGPFISVIDAIPTDGFNPVWEEVQITFLNNPRQLFSDDEITDALNAGDITLTFTGEVYWCPIVGPGPNH